MQGGGRGTWQQSVRCQTLMAEIVAVVPRSACHHAGPCGWPLSFMSSALPASVCVQEFWFQEVEPGRGRYSHSGATRYILYKEPLK